MSQPLADKLRPTDIHDVVGQQHILGKGKPLERIISSENIPNMIFHGPSGVGKTTVAQIIAASTNKRLHKINGTSTSIAEIKDIISELDTISAYNGILLYLDEIQYLNKKQQQSLLQYMENGQITLIASTTENPYFYVYNALLSRSCVFEFKPIAATDIQKAVKRAFDITGIKTDNDVIAYISKISGGDVRKAINNVELCTLAAAGKPITLTLAKEMLEIAPLRYDRDGDEHYDVLSAFQKSIRGSDENAALHYLARLLESGDIISPCRRLLVIASEDIGLAFPQAVSIVKACIDSAMQLGLPEGRLPLAQAVILLCTSPKSNSVICAIDSAVNDLLSSGALQVPHHLRDSNYKGDTGYKYTHAYPNHYVKQQYLPDELKDRVYYEFGDNKLEQQALAYRESIKKESK